MVERPGPPSAVAGIGAPEPSLSQKQIPGLDGMRAFSILATLITHSFATLPKPNSGALGSILDVIIDSTVFGIEAFFVLSGFLITGILLDTVGNPGYFKNFYVRRVLRLFPVYYTYLLILMFVLPWLHRAVGAKSMADYTGNWWWYLTYFCNWKEGFAAMDPFLGHFWSLALEEQFYMVWPLILFLTPRRYLVWLCGALIVSALGLRILWSSQHVYWNQIYRMTPSRWDDIAFGALAAIIYRAPGWRAAAAKWAYPVMLGGTFGLLTIALTRGTFAWVDTGIQTIGATFTAVVFFGMILHLALNQESGMARFLGTPVLRRIAQLSYGMYVLHVIFITHFAWVAAYVAKSKHWPEWVATMIFVVILSNIATYLCASLSWRYFESPIMKLKRHFA